MKRLRLLALLVGLVAAPALAQTAPPQPGVSHEIAFAASKPGEQTDIYLLNIDTGEMRNLTNSPQEEYFPSWSPDGIQLAYSVQETDSEIYDISIVNMQSKEEYLIRDTGISPHRILWTPDGESLIYSGSENWVLSSDNVNKKKYMAKYVIKEQAETPIWSGDFLGAMALSPDGKYLVFSEPSGIWGTGFFGPPWDLVRGRGDFFEYKDPAWSSDGKQIAYVSDLPEESSEIHVMDINGRNKRRLTYNNADDLSPQWIPGKQEIAFISNWDGKFDIYAMKADGSSNRRNLTRSDADIDKFIVSPDGSHIAFTVRQAEITDLYVMDVDGSHIQKLTDGEFEYVSGISWRPVPATSNE